MKCQKSGRVCPGYRSHMDVHIRDETGKTAQRAQRSNKKALAKQKVKRSPTVTPEPHQVILPRSPSPDYEDIAFHHFMSNFVLFPKNHNGRGFMDYIVPMYKADAPDGGLRAAFNACALASLCGREKSDGRRLDSRGLEWYNQALVANMRVLNDREACRTNNVLASVLLCGLYESITNQPLGLMTWGSHTKAAILLVRSGGRKRLLTPEGRGLFGMVRTLMIIHALTASKPVPVEADWWKVEDKSPVRNQDPFGGKAQYLAIEVADLRAEIGKRMNELIRSDGSRAIMRALIHRCFEVDQRIRQWRQDVPKCWDWKVVSYELKHCVDGDYSRIEALNGPIHLYPDLYTASVWNLIRTCRLALMSLIVRCAAWAYGPSNYRTLGEYATAMRVCTETIEEIVASVPCQLGWHQNKPEIKRNNDLSAFACGEEAATKGLAGYFLTWALANVSHQDYSTDAQRAWAIGRLRYIGDVLGVRYAKRLSEVRLDVSPPPSLSLLC